jgi:hypothetical protein
VLTDFPITPSAAIGKLYIYLFSSILSEWLATNRMHLIW